MKVKTLIHHREYRKGESIYKEGDKLDSIVIINEGSAKALKYTADGREQILYVFSEGDFFGEQYLLSDQIATFTVETLEKVKVCMFSKENFTQLILNYPNIAMQIIEELGERVTQLLNTIQNIGAKSVDARVSSLLLDFSKKYGKKVPEGTLIRLPLSREGMANYLGLARETVSRKLGQFESEGYIQSVSNKSILLKEEEAIRDIAGNA
jgi:CRP/FNR family transcriptional regulator